MTEISTPPPIEEDENMTPEPSSPWVMLVTMLLLISGLIVSSATLLHFAMNGQEGAAWEAIIQSVTEDGKDLSVKMKTAENQGEPGGEDAASTVSNPSKPSIMHLFSREKNDGTVRWPKLKVTGFGKSTDTEAGFAIINGKHILVNNFIGDVKLVEIRTHGAVVEYKGEQKVLTLER